MKKLHSIVCMKPVPDPSRFDKLKLDPATLLLCRDQVPPVVNPLDRNAIEAALTLRESRGGSVSVLTMAAPSADEQLREALAMGCDRAVLLTDRAFAGADTLATARVLHAAIRKLGRFDFVFCGAWSADGSTGQVGPQVAELLGIPDLTRVFQLELGRGGLRAHCRIEGGSAVYECAPPMLVTLDKEANVPRYAGMVGIRKALQREVSVWNAKSLKLSPKEVGLEGSPTKMLNVYTSPVGRKGEILQGTPAEAGKKLLAQLRKAKAIA